MRVSPAEKPLEGKRFVCRPEGNGFVVLNCHLHWTPVLQFGHAFDASYAAHLAKWKGGYTAESLVPATPRDIDLTRCAAGAIHY